MQDNGKLMMQVFSMNAKGKGHIMQFWQEEELDIGKFEIVGVENGEKWAI